MGMFIELRAEDGFLSRGYLARPPAGNGPGIIVQQEIFGLNRQIRGICDLLAEDGYVVVAPDLFARLERDVDLGYTPPEFEKALALYSRFDDEHGLADVGAAITTLRAMPEVAGGIGTIGFCLGGRMVVKTAARHEVDCAVSYYGVNIEDSLDLVDDIRCPMVLHFAELDSFNPPATVERIRRGFAGSKNVKINVYAGVDHAFASPERPPYNKPAAMMAYSRSLALFRKVLGPEYDLSALWDKHLECEFASRDLEANMKTMVAQPYVNDIPTLTGGVGYDELYNFYKHHFLFVNPADTKITPISRTIGSDRVVDEMLFCFTHDREIDWMLPGVEPTGKYVEVPLVAIVNFRGDKLYHEHIYWDQASVLVQLGLIDRAELPVVGIESAQKLLNEHLPSNHLMRNCTFRRVDAEPFPSR
jgi:carboxymethylenebutenolidase